MNMRVLLGLPNSMVRISFKALRRPFLVLTFGCAHKDTLCRNLINGGVQRETIELLSTQSSSNTSEPHTINHGSQVSTNGPCGSDLVHEYHASTRSSQGSHARPYAFLPYTNSYSNLSTGDGTKINGSESASNSSTDSENDSMDGDDAPSGALLGHTTSKPIVEPTATRTVQLLNLAEGTTIADVTSIVRGGLIVNIYFRARDNMVALSFLHSRDAHAFYQYVQANGLYIKNTKVVPFGK
ncbi:RNA recognition motif containing protein, partial [Metarhizium majus ARSEF 297]